MRTTTRYCIGGPSEGSILLDRPVQQFLSSERIGRGYLSSFHAFSCLSGTRTLASSNRSTTHCLEPSLKDRLFSLAARGFLGHSLITLFPWCHVNVNRDQEEIHLSNQYPIETPEINPRLSPRDLCHPSQQVWSSLLNLPWCNPVTLTISRKHPYLAPRPLQMTATTTKQNHRAGPPCTGLRCCSPRRRLLPPRPPISRPLPRQQWHAPRSF